MTTDPAKKQLAQKARLHISVFRVAHVIPWLPLDVENAVACNV